MKTLREIQDELAGIVIGQEESIKSISTAMYKHLLKLQARNFGVVFDSSTTILLLGNTGVGNTHLAKNIAKIVNLDFVEINAKEISQKGWSGTAFTDHLDGKLPYNATDAVVFIDEFDKLLTANISSGGDDVNYHLQCSLLKYVEGQVVERAIGSRKVNFNTKNCIFIFAGAFVGLKTEPQKQIGYSHDKERKGLPIYDALIEFGMIPEMAGRIQNVSTLRDLEASDYYNILDSDYFVYNLYKEILSRLGVSLKEPRDILVAKAMEKNLGVRGLIQEVEELVTRTMNENIDNMDISVLQGVSTVPATITDEGTWWNPKDWRKRE